jgi:hypothetical protein
MITATLPSIPLNGNDYRSKAAEPARRSSQAP